MSSKLQHHSQCQRQRSQDREHRNVDQVKFPENILTKKAVGESAKLFSS